MKPLVIGCGNRQRCDDGAGILVAEKLGEFGMEACTCDGEAADLIEAWRRVDDVIIVDAVVTGAPVGTLHEWDNRKPVTSNGTSTSTHGFGVAEAIELARVLNLLPSRLRVYGIEGLRFEPGTEISSAVAHAVEQLAHRILAELNVSSNEDQPSVHHFI